MSNKIEWDVCDRLRGRKQGAMRSGSRRRDVFERCRWQMKRETRSGSRLRTSDCPDMSVVMRKRQQCGEPDEPNVMRKRQQEVLNNG